MNIGGNVRGSGGDVVVGYSDKCVGLKDRSLVTVPLEVAIQKKEIEAESYYKLIKLLT